MPADHPAALNNHLLVGLFQLDDEAKLYLGNGWKSPFLGPAFFDHLTASTTFINGRQVWLWPVPLVLLLVAYWVEQQVLSGVSGATKQTLGVY